MFTTNKATLTGASLALGLTAIMSPIAPSAQAATLTYSGTTLGAPTWNRPNQGTPPGGLNLTATAVPYSVFEFTVGTSGLYDFLSMTTNWNNFTVLYQNAFNPSTPLINDIVANNNFNTNRLSGFDDINLSTGTNYFFVTTGNANDQFGAFSNTITGDGPISAVTPVPEPATILGSLVAFGYGVYFNRKMKSSKAKKDS
jgi:hypothetical protein